MTWKSQPVGHAGLCGALSGRKASESSLAASYLALVGARIQGMNLSLTPLLVNKPNTVGKMRCEVEDAAVSMPCLPFSLLLSLINPQLFPLVSARNQIPPPSFTEVLNL